MAWWQSKRDARWHDPEVPQSSEADEQKVLVEWLEFYRVRFFHPPNGGWRHIATARAMKALGVKSGVPDIIITSRSPVATWARGIAIEMKTAKGGVTSTYQRAWHAALREDGWEVFVAKGAEAAIQYLKSLGFGR
jgi:hypothetical protein